jgi:hypothetical protein
MFDRLLSLYQARNHRRAWHIQLEIRMRSLFDPGYRFMLMAPNYKVHVLGQILDMDALGVSGPWLIALEKVLVEDQNLIVLMPRVRESNFPVPQHPMQPNILDIPQPIQRKPGVPLAEQQRLDHKSIPRIFPEIVEHAASMHQVADR